MPGESLKMMPCMATKLARRSQSLKMLPSLFPNWVQIGTISNFDLEFINTFHAYFGLLRSRIVNMKVL